MKFPHSKLILLAGGILFIVAANIFYYKNSSDAAVTFLPDNEITSYIINDVENAKESIYTAIYIFKPSKDKNDEISMLRDSIVRAVKRGVKVHFVMDVAEDDITTEINKRSGEDLFNNGVDVRYDMLTKKLHSKLTVIDKKITYIGSHNYTNSAFSKNKEASVRIESDKIAKESITYIEGVK